MLQERYRADSVEDTIVHPHYLARVVHILDSLRDSLFGVGRVDLHVDHYTRLTNDTSVRKIIVIPLLTNYTSKFVSWYI